MYRPPYDSRRNNRRCNNPRGRGARGRGMKRKIDSESREGRGNKRVIRGYFGQRRGHNDGRFLLNSIISHT